MDEIRLEARGRLFSCVDRDRVVVVIVEVGPLARVLAVEDGRAGRQAEVLEVHRLGRAGARMVRVDLGVRGGLGQVLAEQDRAARGIDDGVVEGGRGRAIGHVPRELRAVGGAEQHEPGEVTAREGRGPPCAGGAGAHRQRALDVDVALEPRERVCAADVRHDRVDREVVARRAGDREDTPGAVDRDAEVVVEGGDAPVELAELHDGEPVRRRRPGLEVEPVEVGGVEAEGGEVGAHELPCDVRAPAAARAAQRAVGAEQLARGAGQRVDAQHALAAEAALERAARTARQRAGSRRGDRGPRADGLAAGGRARVEVGLGVLGADRLAGRRGGRGAGHGEQCPQDEGDDLAIRHGLQPSQTEPLTQTAHPRCIGRGDAGA